MLVDQTSQFCSVRSVYEPSQRHDTSDADSFYNPDAKPFYPNGGLSELDSEVDYASFNGFQ